MPWLNWDPDWIQINNFTRFVAQKRQIRDGFDRLRSIGTAYTIEIKFVI